jgi:hypothetical protein
MHIVPFVSVIEPVLHGDLARHCSVRTFMLANLEGRNDGKETIMFQDNGFIGSMHGSPSQKALLAIHWTPWYRVGNSCGSAM